MRLPILAKGQTATGKNGVVHADDQTMQIMIARYDPRRHEAPVTIGPPKDTAPAYGWVQTLSQAGNVLFVDANFIDVSIEEDIRRGKRRVEKTGFYPDLSLRHVALSGDIPLLPGLAPLFKGDAGSITFEFDETDLKGGAKDMDMNDPRMKAFLRLGDEIYCGLKPKEFAEGDDPGEILHRKAMDIMMNPPRFDRHGNEIRDEFGYAKALEMAYEQNPELTARYIRQIENARDENSKPALLR